MVKILGLIVLGGVVIALFITIPQVLFFLVIAAVVGKMALELFKSL